MRPALEMSLNDVLSAIRTYYPPSVWQNAHDFIAAGEWGLASEEIFDILSKSAADGISIDPSDLERIAEVYNDMGYCDPSVPERVIRLYRG